MIQSGFADLQLRAPLAEYLDDRFCDATIGEVHKSIAELGRAIVEASNVCQEITLSFRRSWD
jgi:hypothetical protein